MPKHMIQTLMHADLYCEITNKIAANYGIDEKQFTKK